MADAVVESIFKAVDADGSGSISVEEMEACFKKV